MKSLFGILKPLAWMAGIASPLVFLFWAWFICPRKLEEWMGWPKWIDVPLSVLAGILVAGAYIMLVWPRMFGSPPGGSIAQWQVENTDADETETGTQAKEPSNL